MSSVDPTRGTGSSKGTKRSGTPTVGKGKGKKGKSKEELQSVADDLSTQHGALSRRLIACAQQGSVQALAKFVPPHPQRPNIANPWTDPWLK